MATTTFSAMQPMSGSMELVVELIWQHAVSNLSQTRNEILLPVDILSLIGHANLETIKGRFSNLLNTPVIGFQDNANNVYRIMPTPALDGSINPGITQSFPIATDPVPISDTPNVRSGHKTTPQTKPEKIPRPPNAFILYRQHHHPLIKASHPEYHNNDISVLLGKKWKAETAETKAHFKALADEIKRKHAEQHPNYQYAPRKPSEKKRRSTARRPAIRAAVKPVATNGDSLSLSPSIGNSEPTHTAVEIEASSVPRSATSTPRIQCAPSQEFEDMLENHSRNLDMGTTQGNFLTFRRHNSPALSVSVPPLVPTANTTVLSNEIDPHDEGNTYAWNTLDFDFDDYFIGGAE